MKKMLASVLMALSAASAMAADVYYNPLPSSGNQNFTGMLGNDFLVHRDVTVTAIGAFNGYAAGFSGTITVGLYDITDLLEIHTVISPHSFSSATGTTPYSWQSASATLLAGHTYSVQASGYGADPNGNTLIGGSLSFDNLGGALTQLNGRYGTSAALGVAGDATGAYAFGAGNVQAVPEPETFAMLLAGLGLIGVTMQRRRQA